MAEYRVELTRSAARELGQLDRTVARRILTAFEELASDPRPRRSRKLIGSEDSYRVRVGAYRVLYQVDDGSAKVTVYAIGHRREVYR